MCSKVKGFNLVTVLDKKGKRKTKSSHRSRMHYDLVPEEMSFLDSFLLPFAGTNCFKERSSTVEIWTQREAQVLSI